jgi:hypothetical protein
MRVYNGLHFGLRFQFTFSGISRGCRRAAKAGTGFTMWAASAVRCSSTATCRASRPVQVGKTTMIPGVPRPVATAGRRQPPRSCAEPSRHNERALAKYSSHTTSTPGRYAHRQLHSCSTSRRPVGSGPQGTNWWHIITCQLNPRRSQGTTLYMDDMVFTIDLSGPPVPSCAGGRTTGARYARCWLLRIALMVPLSRTRPVSVYQLAGIQN